MTIRQILRKLAAGAMVAAGISVLAVAISDTNNAGNKDYISYWSAGQLLVKHANPYDTRAVLQLEKSAGFSDETPLIMRNPPYALLLALPLGFVSAKLGAILWSLALVASIIVSVHSLRSIYARGPDRNHLFGYLFAPTVACLILGQTSVFVLLGAAIFLRLFESKPVWAGTGLALMAIKPHLLVPFGLVLVAWIISSSSYRVLLGGGLALVAASIPPLCFNPSLWREFLPVMRQAEDATMLIPNASAVVRLIVHQNAAWTQFALIAVGSVWALYYFHRQRSYWNWTRHGSLLLLVSLLVAPYSWMTDEIALMPAILEGIYFCERHGRSLVSFAILDGIALAAILFGITLGTGFYVWTPIAWLSWYLYATRSQEAFQVRQIPLQDE